MNCQRFEDVVTDIAREQIIDAGAREAALGHSEGCESCAAKLSDERAITLGLRDLLENLGSAGAPARVETRLLAAFESVALVQFPPQVSARRYQARYLIGAIAAGLLIVFGASATLWRRPAPVTDNTQTARIENAGALPVAAITTTPPVTHPPPILVKTRGRSTGSRNKYLDRPKALPSPSIRPASAANTEIATDFMPLTYGATTNLEEGGRMIRVELPHSAMATFGLPMNMDRANEIVKADVLYGVDGLAHAIRFVR